MRRYLARIKPHGTLQDQGAMEIPLLDPATLTWEGMYDSRAIVGFPDGAALTTWVDSSGHGRNMTRAAASAPFYRAVSSVTGLPMVDFATAGKDALNSTYPAISNAAGLSFISYYTQDLTPPTTLNTFQNIAGNTGVAMWGLQSAVVSTANGAAAIARPAGVFTTNANALLRAEPRPTVAPYITVAPHVSALILRPPAGANGRVEFWYDGRLVAINTTAGWTTTITTTPFLGGGGVAVAVKGRIGFCGIASFPLSVQQIVGLTRYLRATFG